MRTKFKSLPILFCAMFLAIVRATAGYAQGICPAPNTPVPGGPLYITGMQAGVVATVQINTYDFAIPNDPRFAFFPSTTFGDTSGKNGRGLAVVGNDVFYTYLTNFAEASDGIHVAPFGPHSTPVVDDCVPPLPNPDPRTGIEALSFSNGLLYALVGYPDLPPVVYGLDPQTGAVKRSVAIGSPASPNSSSFTVLPNGNFLINDRDQSCIYNVFDPVNGARIEGNTIILGSGQNFPQGFNLTECQGVDTDGQSLYFAVNGSGILNTSLTGDFLSHTVITNNALEDISLVHHYPDTTSPTTTAGLSQLPNAAGWINSNASVVLTATDPPSAAGLPASGVTSISYAEVGAQTLSPTTTTSNPAVVAVTAEGVTTISFHATDVAGNQEIPDGSITVKVDRTPPAIAFSGNAGTYSVAQTITISCSATDAVSGIASDTCATARLNAVPAYTRVGSTTLQATATDVAGNTASASTTCTVVVTVAGLCTLQAQFVQGSAAYARLTAAQKSTTDKGLAAQCQTLGKLAAATPKQKPTQLMMYQQAVNKWVQSGLITASQAQTLLTLAGSL